MSRIWATREHLRKHGHAFAKHGIHHSSQPNIARPDGCRHPLPARTSVQVHAPLTTCNDATSPVSSGSFRTDSGGAATTAALIRRVDLAATSRRDAPHAAPAPPRPATPPWSSDRPPAPRAAPPAAAPPPDGHLQRPRQVLQPLPGPQARLVGHRPPLPQHRSARAGRPRRAAAARPPRRAIRRAGSCPAPAPPAAPTAPAPAAAAPARPAPAAPRPAPPPPAPRPSGPASRSAPRSLWASSTARTSSSYRAAACTTGSPGARGTAAPARGGPVQRASRTPRTAAYEARPQPPQSTGSTSPAISCHHPRMATTVPRPGRHPCGPPLWTTAAPRPHGGADPGAARPQPGR